MRSRPIRGSGTHGTAAREIYVLPAPSFLLLVRSDTHAPTAYGLRSQGAPARARSTGDRSTHAACQLPAASEHAHIPHVRGDRGRVPSAALAVFPRLATSTSEPEIRAVLPLPSCRAAALLPCRRHAEDFSEPCNSDSATYVPEIRTTDIRGPRLWLWQLDETTGLVACAAMAMLPSSSKWLVAT